MTENAEPYSNSSLDPYGVLQPIMRFFGASCAPEQFYWAVNEAYHSSEAAIYDSIHSDMYEEEEFVWKRLLGMVPPSQKRLRFLDVGCGTGLVAHFVARMCPHRVAEMHMLDPSIAMIDNARQKAGKWPFETLFHHGDIFSLPTNFSYDVITINSVLHHVVELEPFLKRVQDALRPGGVLLTAQDPRSGANPVSVLCERKASVNRRLEAQVSPFVRMRHSVKAMIKSALGIQRHGPLTMATNKLLLDKGVIVRPMDSKSIWAVTDFHVPGQPGGFGAGIDISAYAARMPHVRLAAMFTYNYHGTSWTKLTDKEREQEKQWWAAMDPHGSEVASVFYKCSPRDL